MKRLKTKIIAFCLLLAFSIASPTQIQTTNLNPLSPQKTITVQAKAKKKTVKKKNQKKTTKKTAAKKKTTKKVTKSVTVYTTPTGECYHRYACGRGSYSKTTLKSAKLRGLRPCKKCY